MDAVKFVKEWKRMCISCKTCNSCSIWKSAGMLTVCSDVVKEEPEKYVAIVEKWSEEHPVKTRQSELLKMFPDAKLTDNEIIYICPKFIDKTYKDHEDCLARKCCKCKKEYWLAEVE